MKHITNHDDDEADDEDLRMTTSVVVEGVS